MGRLNTLHEQFQKMEMNVCMRVLGDFMYGHSDATIVLDQDIATEQKSFRQKKGHVSVWKPHNLSMKATLAQKLSSTADTHVPRKACKWSYPWAWASMVLQTLSFEHLSMSCKCLWHNFQNSSSSILRSYARDRHTSPLRKKEKKKKKGDTHTQCNEKTRLTTTIAMEWRIVVSGP